MEHINASPLRGRIRPHSPPTNSSSKPPPANLNPSSSSSPSTSSTSPTPTGVVVVGFLGSKPSTDLTHLINRVLDDSVFGSGNLDKDLFTFSVPDEAARDKEDCFRRRRITYYHEPEKGMVFLHYSALSPLRLLLRSDEQGDGAASRLEECEADDLRSMLLMFSVCHVIVFVHEGLRFNIQILQKFRLLQTAKHALFRFVRSQITPLSSCKQSLPISQPLVSRPSSISPPTGMGGSSGRHGSAISLMSGHGSQPSMLPGQCIPVILFVFEDDFFDGSTPATNVDDPTDAYWQNMTLKGSGSVVMLARPACKAESSFRRRLQSSLESQIRFLIKKCRILTGTDHVHSGSRGVGNANSLPLFLLDASRVVTLLDRSVNQRGEPLNFVTSLIDEALISKEKVDAIMLESHCEKMHNEDIQCIKDFILRQADMLRGRGGLPSNVSSVSGAGVGVVAAAAAAAASAAAGKLMSAPELPSLESWLTSTNQIFMALCFLGHGSKNDIISFNGLQLQRSAIEKRDVQAVDDAITCLENSKGLNAKFSICWCKKALPAAKEVYLKDLPAYYPTSMHNKQMEKALLAFYSMVKGPAVEVFAKKLADQCTSIWEGGRQLCDAISLTGKTCMHRRHDVTKTNSFKEDSIIQHSSGYVFLHACACGRSRRLRDDPFDFENANVTFNHFTNCENLLPSLFISSLSNQGPLPPNSWSLMRVGGAGYYEPSKGLLQTGFSSSQKFLMKWTISTDKQKETNFLPLEVVGKDSVVSLSSDPKMIPGIDVGKKKSTEVKFNSKVQLTSEGQKKTSELVPSNVSSISFGKGLPSFIMKKPFAEVVAGTAAADSTLLVLKQRKHMKDITDKAISPSSVASLNDGRKITIDDHRASQVPENVPSQGNAPKPEANSQTNGNPYLHIGTNIVPVDMHSSGEKDTTCTLKQSTIYVGFEHECPYGHRFLLSLEHLKNLDPSYALTSSTSGSEGKYPEVKNGVQEILDQYSSIKAAGSTSMKYANKLNESAIANDDQSHNSFTTFSTNVKEKLQVVGGLHILSESVHRVEEKISQVRLDDGSSAFSLLTRNLPVYMNCPYCNNSAKHRQQKVKFASKISQLQRIFLVTPSFPTVLSTCPVIQFEESCLPPSIPDRVQKSRFSFGCRAILPPDSFLTLRLPFVYGVRKDDESLQPLSHFEDKPELTAWLAKGTTLQVVSMGHESI